MGMLKAISGHLYREYNLLLKTRDMPTENCQLMKAAVKILNYGLSVV